MAERICARFTGKTCLVPRSDEFECQRSTSPGTKKNEKLLSSPLTMDGKTCVICYKIQTGDRSIPWPPGSDGSAADGDLHAVYVW